MEKTIAAISTGPGAGGDWYCAPLRTGGVLHWGKGVPGRQREETLPDEGYTAQLGGAYTPAGEKLDDVVAWCTGGQKATPARTWWSSPATGGCT